MCALTLFRQCNLCASHAGSKFCRQIPFSANSTKQRIASVVYFTILPDTQLKQITINTLLGNGYGYRGGRLF